MERQEVDADGLFWPEGCAPLLVTVVEPDYQLQPGTICVMVDGAIGEIESDDLFMPIPARVKSVAFCQLSGDWGNA